MTMDVTDILILSLIGCTLPLVMSVLGALHPAARVVHIEDYFLYHRNLGIDDFLRTSIGYSLQAAAIALFFAWTFSYGLRAMVVPAAWGLGYFALAYAVKRGYLDRFLTDQRNLSGNSLTTIHYYVGQRLIEQRSTLSRAVVLLLALCTVIGLGGTMITEVDYATRFLSQAIGIDKPNVILELTAHGLVLGFCLLYVLWGGYRAVVVTERIQVPSAYFSFGIFVVGLAVFLRVRSEDASSATLIVIATSILFVVVFAIRHALGRRTHDSQVRTAAVFTFVPLIATALAALLYIAPGSATFSIDRTLFFPEVASWFGFGLLGTISLVFANIVWQFIDISSLQRLQSIGHKIETKRSDVVSGIRVTGIEAAAGWTLLILAALLLRAIGVSDTNQVANVLSRATGFAPFLLPLFVFSVAVFMLSTISTFISAIAYVSYCDVLPSLGLTDGATWRHADRRGIALARIVTIFSVLSIYVGYLALKAHIGFHSDQIAGVLYAIYSFQLAITPSVFHALTGKQEVGRTAALLSALSGLVVAWFSATAATPWFSLPADSWYVSPPAWVLAATFSVYWTIRSITAR